MNQLVIVGKISQIMGDTVVLKVPRPYKNEDGKYEEDFIPAKVSENIMSKIKDYCDIGDTIAIKGMIQSSNNGIYIFTEKVSFLSSKKEEE